MVMINGFVKRYTPWAGAEERIETKIKDIKLLPDVMAEMGKSVLVHMALNDVNPTNIDAINDLVDRYKGAKRFNLMIFDPEKRKVAVRMPRRAGGVDISKDFLDELLTKDFLKVSINA
jgi:hypothetical protein